VSLILGNGRHFDFGSVREVFVDQANDKITRIKITSFKYSKQVAMDRLIEINRQEKGKEINKADPWVPFIEPFTGRCTNFLNYAAANVFFFSDCGNNDGGCCSS